MAYCRHNCTSVSTSTGHTNQLHVLSGRPSKIPAKNHSASWLINFVSSFAAPCLPVFASASDTANKLLPFASLKDTCMCLCPNPH